MRSISWICRRCGAGWMPTGRCVVVVAAAKVGGILANGYLSWPISYDNLTISANVIHSAFEFETQKLLYLDRVASTHGWLLSQSLKRLLLTGPLEPTNEWYAIAKIAASSFARRIASSTAASSLRCRRTCSPNDNFDLAS